MRLVIHQFKCYTNVTFEFKQALVCGPSGAGKSTLLDAVRFALRGDAADNMKVEKSVELIGPNFHLVRASSPPRLLWNGKEGQWHQELIDEYFRYYVDKPIKEILFPPGRPTPEILRQRCAAEIRALESQLDQLEGSLSILERDVGAPPSPANLCSAQEFLYLKNKQFLYTNYVQKVEHLQQELQALQMESSSAAMESDAYSIEDLQRHVCAERELVALADDWTQFQTYMVDECRDMVAEYREDVERARNPYRPEVHQELQHKYEEMCLALLPCPSCDVTLAVRDNRLFIASPTCVLTSPQQLVECKTALDHYAAAATHVSEPEESLEFLEVQLKKWTHYLQVAEAIQRLRPALLPEVTNAATQLQRLQRATYIQERISTLIQRISTLHAEAAKVHLVDYSSALAFDVDRYQELVQTRAAASKLRRRKKATQQLLCMIQATEEKYTQSWLMELEGRINALCRAAFEDEFCVRFGKAVSIHYKGMDMTPDKLSSGEFARYQLCHTLALAQQCGTRILLLDEVLVHLDVVARERTLALLQDQLSFDWLLFVSHDTDVPFLHEEVIRLNHVRIQE